MIHSSLNRKVLCLRVISPTNNQHKSVGKTISQTIANNRSKQIVGDLKALKEVDLHVGEHVEDQGRLRRQIDPQGRKGLSRPDPLDCPGSHGPGLSRPDPLDCRGFHAPEMSLRGRRPHC